MGLRNAMTGFWTGLTGAGADKIKVVDAQHKLPTGADVPRAWTSTWMGPGAPVGGLMAQIGGNSTARGKDRELEPRSFQYAPNANAIISPRGAYGLMQFTDLRDLAENVPEVAMCIRIVMEELKSFTPTIKDKTGKPVSDPALDWMIKTPDLFNPWPVWLSRFLYNVLVYDAGAIYRPRDSKGHVMALRVIDGSTLMVMIDERGEQPAPPAPAFAQVIYGVQKNYYNTYQIWYRPRHLRADSPYGRSPIEDCLQAVYLLKNLWEYESSWYTEGTTPEQLLTAPGNWTPEQILEFEQNYNARMAGNTGERAGRIRFVPAGTESIGMKDAQFRQDIYEAAANTVRMTFGIPRTEFGESPSGGGLGGSGFLDAMQNVFFRMCLSPMKAYLESLFNETLQDNGYDGYEFELSFPQESLDPKKEEEKAMNRFTQGVMTRDETRSSLGLEPLGGPEGEFLAGPGNQQQPGMEPGAPGGAGMIPVANRIPVTNRVPVSNQAPVNSRVPVNDQVPVTEMIPVEKLAKGAGIDPEDDAYFGSPVRVDGERVEIGAGRLALRPAIWKPGAALSDEGVYLIDRVLAQDTDHYLVPVAYQASVDGVQGLVSLPVSAAAAARNVSNYGDNWKEQSAVLDYIAGVERQDQQYATHPDDPMRPVLIGTGVAFGVPRSPFFAEMGGRELSGEMVQSLVALSGDEVLWRDVADCCGIDAATEARNRVDVLRISGIFPHLTQV